MNREIKFRGKQSGTAWVYGFFYTEVSQGCVTHLIVDNVEQFAINEPIGVEKVEYPIDTRFLGEFTELKDKNGKEIYEGDIIGIKLDDKVEPKGYYICNCEVKKYKGCWCLFQVGFDYSKSPFDEIGILHNEKNEIEVVGNIHDK